MCRRSQSVVLALRSPRSGNVPFGVYFSRRVGNQQSAAAAAAAPGVSLRPRRELDVDLLRELRARGYGYKPIGGEYTEETGEYISHTTVRKRLVDVLHSAWSFGLRLQRLR